MTGPPADAAREWSAYARRWIVVFLAAGVAWRLVRHGLGFPLWYDEAALMLNLVERHAYADLLRPLEYLQVAPLGFLAAQFTALRHLGASEHALRLVPLVTSLTGLFLVARLAWLTLPPLGAMAAVGVLAATHYVTRYSLDIKPYGADLMVSAMLLVLAVAWSRAPERRRWPLLLMLVTPAALALSYPSVFVAGAAGIGVLPALRRRRAGPDAWALWVAYGAVVALSFAGLLSLSAGGQYEHTRDGMLAYWARGLPPVNPFRFVAWLVEVHASEMLAYPLGGRAGASALTLVLCVVGIRALFRRGQTDLLLLLGSAFALTLAAAALRRYPYGGSARVAQHLAPAICLFVGAAVERLVSALATAERRRRAAMAVGLALLVLALGGTVRDVLHPYQRPGHQELYRLTAGWKRDLRPEAGVWLMDPLESLSPPIQWYVLRVVEGDRARLDGGLAEPSRLATRREWWVLNGDPAREGDASHPPRVQLAGSGYVLRETRRLVWTRPRPGVPGRIVQIERWQRPP